MSALLNQYNVSFYAERSQRGDIRKSARGGGVASFLDDFKDIEDIQEAINSLDYYINGGSFNYENNTISAEMYTAWLDNDLADIYPSVGNTEMLLQSVPLVDFKEILQQWALYLES